ncbi:hypothetical protein BCR36DRAFT_456880 [Piromyces finnis]|uniref:Uncharacterized protein n=1 Tax=Piromyces finnis TaxID=1754191 RepID=A0A1Y1V3A9_9FUNG|nr:hypothetical protein BCR36DRAFT_456880 [Piromyces finnis]|eukprot:ORX45641.1 hypothetical protein BCR36DRAFT_456880 [Piromyces finnis]
MFIASKIPSLNIEYLKDFNLYQCYEKNPSKEDIYKVEKSFYNRISGIIARPNSPDYIKEFFMDVLNDSNFKTIDKFSDELLDKNPLDTTTISGSDSDSDSGSGSDSATTVTNPINDKVMEDASKVNNNEENNLNKKRKNPNESYSETVLYKRVDQRNGKKISP